MFHLFRQNKGTGSNWPWRRAPESRLDAVVRQFLADTAEIADDAAIAIDADLRSVIARITPDERARYASIVQVPGAFPPYLVWASLAALDAPAGGILDTALARRVHARLLDLASQTRGPSNGKLLSAFLYRIERSATRGVSPLDVVVERFWEELQRMGAVSQAGCDALSDSTLARDVLAQRLLFASRHRDERYGGSFWISMKPDIEQEAREANGH